MRRLVTAAVVIGAILIIGTWAVASEPEVPKMIAGKPYRITTGTKPNTYVVKWGGESMTWERWPGMEDVLKAKGPAYYLQWTQKDMPFPWEVPLDQRDKMPAEDLVDRCIAYNYYGPYHKGGTGIWNNLVVRPDGSVSETEHFVELWQTYVGGKNKSF